MSDRKQPLAPRGLRSSGPPRLLGATLLALLIFPPTLVFAPMGASGSVAEILALCLAGTWLASSVLGLHRPHPFGHPGRVALLVLLLVSCASYVLLFCGLSGPSTPAGRAAADRWMLLMVSSAGIAFVTTERIRSVEDALHPVRWLLGGATFCSLVALIQFTTRTNPTDWFPLLVPGFTVNGTATSFQIRDALTRVAGTTLHPIELGVVSAMLLPLAVWRALHDPQGSRTAHWMQAGLLLAANAVTVSRSAVLALVLALVLLAAGLPTVARKWMAFAVPAATAAVFVGVPGFVSTLTRSVTDSGSDVSVTWRIDDYPRAIGLVLQKPWWGAGPGNFIPANARDIFDNQYLMSAVTMGVFGLAAFTLYVVVPPYAAVLAMRGSTADSSHRLLAASAASGGIIAMVGSATFDSMEFPVFALLYPFFIGLSGVVWRLRTRNPGLEIGSAMGPPEIGKERESSWIR